MSFGTSRPQSTTDIIKENLATSAGLGAVAFLVGYVITFVLMTIDGVEADDAASWKVAGWVFFGGHNVDLELTLSAGGQSRSETVSVFDEATASNLTSTIPEFLYLLVPIAVLIGAGFLMYAVVGRSLSTGAAAGVGATVAIGYVVLSLLGSFLFEYSQSSGSGDFQVSGSLGPELTMAVLLAGIVYPLLFGGLGGIVGRSASN